ncbi:MAG: DUF3667 domain-containing protein [Cyclobacteriaceae bacterium]|nr:DUF3667 domain-containing protein [Cyclobacteriaceae bacterium]
MDELEKAAPLGEGMVAAEESGKPKRHNENCLNCGTPLVDVFCHHCGQKDLPKRQTLGELWNNFISSFWSYEGKFFLTTRYLITRPGFLAMEYNAGKRERFFHPARMYAFISFVFFLVFFSLPEEKQSTELTEEDKLELGQNDRKVKESLAASELDTVIMNGVDTIVQSKEGAVRYNLAKTGFKTFEAYDSAQALLPESERDGWFGRKFMKRSIELDQKYGEDDSQFGKELMTAIKDNFSKMLFFLLPVFALVLKLLYVRRNYFYSEHLVFSIYYYNFFYFAGSVVMLIGLIPSMDWLSSLVGWWIYFYLLFAMKRMYGQSWGRTILKFVAFSFLFMIAFVLAFTVNVLVIIMFI